MYIEIEFNHFLFLITGALEESSASGVGSPGSGNPTTAPVESKQRHQMKHRELFLSRQVETIPATHIRGKCSVTLLNETESLSSYLNKEVGNNKSIFNFI